MGEMVERIAKAIAISGNGGTWDDWYNEDQREFHRRRARAAIEAMREPTEVMVGAAVEYAALGGDIPLYNIEYVFNDMIDAALK